MDKLNHKGKKEVLPKIDRSKQILMCLVAQMHKTLIKHKEQLKITFKMDKWMECFNNYFQVYLQTKITVEINLLEVDNNNNNHSSNSSNNNQVK